jgi:hypothetical protein
VPALMLFDAGSFLISVFSLTLICARYPE